METGLSGETPLRHFKQEVPPGFKKLKSHGLLLRNKQMLLSHYICQANHSYCATFFNIFLVILIFSLYSSFIASCSSCFIFNFYLL